MGTSGKTKFRTCSRDGGLVGRYIANRNLEAVQEKVGKWLLGASRSVPGAAVRGDLGWRKLEERREGKS